MIENTSDELQTQVVAKDSTDSQWYPSMSGWRFLILMVCSFTIYSYFFVYKIVRDLRDNVDDRLSPGWHVFGFFIPFVNVVLFFILAKKIEAIGESVSRLSTFKVGTLTFLYIITNFASIFFPGDYIFLGVFISILPWLILQLQLNRRLDTLTLPNWRKPSNQFTMPQKMTVVSGCLFGVVIIGLQFNSLSRFIGSENIVAGTVLLDEKGHFQLNVQGDGWEKVRSGALTEDAELEIVNQKDDAWAVVYSISASNYTLDDQVNFRRNEIKESISGKLTIDESRIFLPGAEMIPVSYVKYRYKGNLLSQTWFVATISSPKNIIELVTHQYDADIKDTSLEMLAKGFRLISGKEVIE